MQLYSRFTVQVFTLLTAVLLAGTARSQPVEKLSILGGKGSQKLELHGEAGREYLVEGASRLSPGEAWEPLLRLTVPAGGFDWRDSSSAPMRFYRMSKLPLFADLPEAGNFRLLDQAGKARELHYLSDQKAVVLSFLDLTCPAAARAAAALKTLRDRFAPQGVVFWTVATGAASRAELGAQAAALGIDWPALRDSNQLVVRDMGVHRGSETLAVSTADWTVFYQGAVDDQVDPAIPPTRPYLSAALENFLAGRAVSPSRTPASGCDLALAPVPTPSYSKDVAPILLRSCVHCHSPGNIAPWKMQDYATLKTYASVIKDKVLTGSMPPWHADPAFGKFSNDVSLEPEEARTLAQWAAAGAPRGDGPDPIADLFARQPPPVDYPATWPSELGQPDLVVSIPKFSVPANGLIDYQYINVPINNSSEKWLRAAVILPGNTKVVHHSLVFLGTLFDVLALRGGLGGYFAEYVPGMKAVAYPEGTAKKLPSGASVTFQMHYTSIGTAEEDETKIGFYFAAGAPKAELRTTAAATINIQIPPGTSEYERDATVTPSATKDILLYELSPHMHYRGSRFRFDAVYPNGTTETLLSVPHYEFHWQTLYRLREPKRLPAGTRIHCVGAFDNSPQNPDNPDPKATVRFGEQTGDEMFIGYLNYAEIP